MGCAWLAGAGCANLIAPAATPTTEPRNEADFAVVRSTAEAAYQNGERDLANNDLDRALVDLDQAKTNDPDNRQDITDALNRVLQLIQSASPIPAGSPSPSLTPFAGAPATVPAAPVVPAQPSGSPNAAVQAGAGDLPTYVDPGGVFSLGVPPDWQTTPNPAADIGQGLVQFTAPSGDVRFSVAVDRSAQAVSPELYAASLEVAMEKIQGYSLESVEPLTGPSGPLLRRTFDLPAASGGASAPSHNVQDVLLQGKTPYILTASGPSTIYAQFSRAFGSMLDSFVFL